MFAKHILYDLSNSFSKNDIGYLSWSESVPMLDKTRGTEAACLLGVEVTGPLA